MYQGGDTFHFMNTSNYDQLEWMKKRWVILPRGFSLHEDPGRVLQWRPIGIELPNSMVLEIVDTAPVFRGATKTASSKPAKLSNGVTINVPEFVEQGTRVRVNPTEGTYLDRAKD